VAGGTGFTPGGIPPGPRVRTQASTMLLQQWSATMPWDSPPAYEYKLGPTPLLPGNVPITPKMANMLRNANRYADLVGPIAPNLLVVEAKVVADPSAIGQLLNYVALVTSTPLPQAWQGLLVHPVLLWAIDDPVVHQLATTQGMEVVIFDPPWVADYLSNTYYPS
jgi:hypothetical protein